MNKGDFAGLFKETMHVGSLEPKDRAKYRLIFRYRNRVSERLKYELPVLLEKGKTRFGARMDELASKPNPLDALTKDLSHGSAYIFPIVFGKAE